MGNEIEVTTERRGSAALLRIRGDVTAITGTEVEKAYGEVSDDGAKHIVICFDPGGYINSGGIAILIGITSESRKREQTIRLAGLSDHFQKIFKMVGLTKYADIFPSEEAALEGF